MARTFVAANTHAPQDQRGYSGQGVTVASRTGYDGGYAGRQQAAATPVQAARGSTTTISTTNYAYAWAEYELASDLVITIAGKAWIAELASVALTGGMQNTGVFAGGFAIDKNALCYVFAQDSAGNVTYVSTGTTLTKGTRYVLEWRCYLDGSNKLLCDGRINAGSVTTAGPTTNGSASVPLTRVAVGNGTDNTKGNLLDSYGSLVYTDTATSGDGWIGDIGDKTGPHSEVRLPNADGATLQWTKDGGGTGVYSRWNDALGTWTTSDTSYNESGTGAGPLDQLSTIANTAIAGTATIGGISIIGDGLDNATQSAHQYYLSDGTADAQTPQGVSNSGAIVTMMWGWATPPSGGSWSPSNINGLIIGARRTNGGTQNARQHVIYLASWYFTAASVAGTARSFGAIF